MPELSRNGFTKRSHVETSHQLYIHLWSLTDLCMSVYPQSQPVSSTSSPLCEAPPAGPLSPAIGATTDPPQLPPLLTPGEVIRGSGKYAKPTKIQGKFKDEVVIRNCDSGKGERCWE